MQMTPFNTQFSLRRLSDEFNKMLAQWPSVGDESADVVTSDWTPAVDVKEENKRFLITADLPGVDPKDVEVTMHNGMLTLKGERSEEKKEEKEGYRRVERFSGSFYRRFVLPDTADPDKIKARAKNGVLEVEIGKTKALESKKIKVES
ncbi:MAG TPA: Hsp20/alpha crystallin family protein [Gammaproteobacteria bacterium]|jgi:HSP20 family protein|nr:Hsp20/alpha crystallin family protein [Gammaproteobacteria bacterium]